MSRVEISPTPPRYSETPFPPYRYLPFTGNQPHPRRDPAGHSYGKAEEYLGAFCAADWRSCQPYLYGVDLFNYGYWWEAHEAWETVWLAAGPETPAGQFLQGLIQLAAAQLKRYSGEERGARLLTESGCAKLAVGQKCYLGVELAPFIGAVRRCLEENRGDYPQLRLVF